VAAFLLQIELGEKRPDDVGHVIGNHHLATAGDLSTALATAEQLLDLFARDSDSVASLKKKVEAQPIFAGAEDIDLG